MRRVIFQAKVMSAWWSWYWLWVGVTLAAAMTLSVTVCANRVVPGPDDCPTNKSVIENQPPVWKFRPDPYYIVFDEDELSGRLKLAKIRWEGFQTIDDLFNSDCTTTHPNISASLYFSADFLKFSCLYDVDVRALLSLFSPPWIVSLFGTGDLLFYMDSPSLLLTVTAVHNDVTDFLRVETAELQQLDFQDMRIHAAGLSICGEEIPWDSLELKLWFDALWPLAKPSVDQALLEWLQDLYFGCRLADLIEGGRNDCLNSPNSYVQQLLSTVIGRLFANPNATSVLQILENVCGPVLTTPTETATTLRTPESSTQVESASARLKVTSSAILAAVVPLVRSYMHR